MHGKIAKPILFTFLFLMLCMPLLQQLFRVVESGKLYGDVRNAPDTVFTIKGWWNGRYQKVKNDYLNDNMGFRNDLVRLNSQLDYSLFSKLHANGVVLGKDHYLYEKGYIDVYCGRGYKGDDTVRAEMYKLRRIQDTLEKLGKSMVVIFAPSKARYYSEYIPDYLYCNEPADNLYAENIKLADSFGVKYIDFDGWFLQMKKTLKYKLFAKQGTHWNKYGSILASDSLVKYLERLRGIGLPHIVVTGVDSSDEPVENETDISQGLNLILPFTQERFVHPQYHYTSDSSRKELKTVFIGDSFLWSFMHNKLPENLGKGWEVWFYFNEIWSERPDQQYIGHYDWMQTIRQSDCVIIMNAAVNMHSIGSGFADRAYNKFYGDSK